MALAERLASLEPSQPPARGGHVRGPVSHADREGEVGEVEVGGRLAAGEVRAEGDREGVAPLRVLPAADLPIDGLDARRTYGDEHLARPRLRSRRVLVDEHLRAPVSVQPDCLHSRLLHGDSPSSHWSARAGHSRWRCFFGGQEGGVGSCPPHHDRRGGLAPIVRVSPKASAESPPSSGRCYPAASGGLSMPYHSATSAPRRCGLSPLPSPVVCRMVEER